MDNKLMRCDEVQEAADAYAIGALDAEERADLERHIENCAACRELAERVGLSAASLALTAPLHSAPAELRTRVMHQIRLEGEGAPRGATLKRLFAGDPEGDEAPPASSADHGRRATRTDRIRWRWIQSAAAVLALFLFAGCAVWIARLQTEVSRLQARSQSLQRVASDFEGQRTALLLLASEGSVRLEMQPTYPASGVSGAVIWNPDRHECSILVSGLPAPQSDQTYHIWLVGNERSWDSGEINASGAGTAMKTLDLNTMSNQRGYQVVVSLQPRSKEGGNWQPVLKAWVGIQ